MLISREICGLRAWKGGGLVEEGSWKMTGMQARGQIMYESSSGAAERTVTDCRRTDLLANVDRQRATTSGGMVAWVEQPCGPCAASQFG